MRRPELDVALSDGLAYTVTDAPYRQHLKESVEHKEVSCLVS
jgi:hypothetical protein